MSHFYWTIIGLLLTTISHAEDCLSYRAKQSELIGHLVLISSYGPPNYGENPQTDQLEQNIVLLPERPICVRGTDDPDEPEINNAGEIQLALNTEAMRQYQKLKKDYLFSRKRIRVSGTLFKGFNGHHITDILLETVRVEPAALEKP